MREIVKHKDLLDRLIEFGVMTCKISEKLPKTRTGRHISGQLIDSCTWPAPNYAEAQRAESRRDFVHKLKVCLKELSETHVWLIMIDKLELLRPEEITPSAEECNELIAIFVTSINTANRNSLSLKQT